MVKYKKFQQPCGIQPAACWKALENGRLEIGKMEYPATMNQTRSHMAGEEGCSGSCRRQTRVLERKITQVLMEVLVEKGWIWWNAEKGRAATESGKVTTVLRKPFWRMGYGYGSQETMVPSWQELEERTFPETGEGQLPSTSQESTGPVRLLLQCSEGAERGGEPGWYSKWNGEPGMEGILNMNYWMVLPVIVMIVTGLIMRIQRHLGEVWKPEADGPILARVGEANLPVDGGGTASIN
jgi:hypothetical protein